MSKDDLHILLARQGIYDQSGAVYAYELLYRNNHEQQSNVDNSDERQGVKATSSVIAQMFSNLSVESILGDKPAFINFTYSDIVQGVPMLLPKERVVIEVLETVKMDDTLKESLMQLHHAGYRIALDDFIYHDDLKPLIEIADIIKLDVLQQSKEDIEAQLDVLRDFKGRFLAEKIDNKEQFNCCLQLGFDYFQGFFLNKPDAIKGRAITENTSQIMGLLAALNKPEASFEELEALILQVPKLSYRILRISNSAYYYSGREVKTLEDAIFRIGISKVVSWANLLLLASKPDTSADLIERTIIRAKMCESLAKASKDIHPHDAYTVGMFSTLDGMLNEPMSSLLSQIQLQDALKDALLHHGGKLGKLLKLVIDYEQGDFQLVSEVTHSTNEMGLIYLDAIEHANSILKSNATA